MLQNLNEGFNEIVTLLHTTFVGSAWSFGFFIPATTANDLRLHARCHRCLRLDDLLIVTLRFTFIK